MADARELATKLESWATVRVFLSEEGGKAAEWTIAAAGVPILTGFKSEAAAWIGLSGLCLTKATLCAEREAKP
jgi:hypothetical protein